MTSLGLNRFAPKWLAAAGLLASLALVSTPATAQMTAEQACTNDAFRFCNDAIPDRDKVGACLRRNARNISADCRTFVVGGGRRTTGHTRARTRVHHTTTRKHK